MFCPKCGNNLPDYAAFCNNCGTKMPHTALPLTNKKPSFKEELKKYSLLWIFCLINLLISLIWESSVLVVEQLHINESFLLLWVILDILLLAGDCLSSAALIYSAQKCSASILLLCIGICFLNTICGAIFDIFNHGSVEIIVLRFLLISALFSFIPPAIIFGIRQFKRPILTMICAPVIAVSFELFVPTLVHRIMPYVFYELDVFFYLTLFVTVLIYFVLLFIYKDFRSLKKEVTA